MKKNDPESLLSRREAASRMLILLGGAVAYGCGGGDDPTGGAGGSTVGGAGSGGASGSGGFAGSSGSGGAGTAGTGGASGSAGAGAAGRAGSGGNAGTSGGSAGSGGNGGGGAGTGGKAGSSGSGGNAGSGGNGGNAGSGTDAGSGGSSGSNVDAGNGGSGGVDAGDAGRADGSGGSGGTADAGSDAGCVTDWASGGTKSMTGTYPDPFTGTVSACTLITAVTEGPCTEAADQTRKDVSEGYTGLPVRLALKVVNSACQPIANAKVKIWHTQVSGSYSGNTPNNSMCLKNQSDSSKHYFRGVQNTNESGRVDFDTCFPGWYMGRCIHIHFTVTANGKSYTSQLIFDQALVDEIVKNHVDYKAFGTPDTTNASDSVCGANVPMFTAKAERMCDGAMLASKLLVVNV